MACDRQREHPLARERPRGGDGGRLQLVVVELDAEPAQLLRERRARVGRVVRHEPQPVPLPAQPPLRPPRGSARPRRGGPRRRQAEWLPWTPSLFGASPRSVTRSRVDEIELRFSRSSGPGGQHAQQSETRVEALFDVEASSALTPSRNGGSSPVRGRFCAPSPRTSAASGGTASSRSSDSSSGCARRCGWSGGAGQRGRRRRRGSGAWMTSAGGPKRSASAGHLRKGCVRTGLESVRKRRASLGCSIVGRTRRPRSLT